jgi:Transposase DDE domain
MKPKIGLARETGEFGAKQLKVALDSAPLWGSGRTEDTFNLIGHALEVIVTCAADLLDVEPKVVRDRAELTLVGQSSLKAALDIDWDDPLAQADALQRLMAEVQKLRSWLVANLRGSLQQPQMKEALDLLEKIIQQDLEPDPGGGGKMRIRRGVAADRRISISDKDMRHGRKSKSRLFNGFKRHVVRDIERPFILAATVRPANEPEHLAADILRPEVEALGPVVEFHIDRGYLASQWTAQLDMARVAVIAKPWSVRNGTRFPKTAFRIDLLSQLVTCPAGSSATISKDKASFGSSCIPCGLRVQCTESAKGRTIAIHPQEAMLIRLRGEKATPEGRARLRKRTVIEHTLAHVVRRQGPRARYLGIRKNTFDLRRCSAVENLHALDRLTAAA